MKQVILAILVSIFIFSCAQTSPQVEDHYYTNSYYYTNEGGGSSNSGVSTGTLYYADLGTEIVIIDFIGSGKVTVPSNIDGKPVTSIGVEAFAYNGYIKEVILPQSISSINRGAFYLCSRLTNVIIPSGVTNIQQGAFDSCENLSKITLPVSLQIIESAAFANCSSLTNVTLNSTNIPVLTDINGLPFAIASGIKFLVPASAEALYEAADGWSNYAADIDPY